MDATLIVDLKRVAQDLRLKHQQVEAVVALLDAENTVPFITRYRKDQTGGLDEEQIRRVQTRVTQLRLLAERKQTILRSIESQGKLTPELAALIEGAATSKLLEDLYLPFKPKKQTLATAARERGLEPLAMEILNADPAAANLDARANDFVSEDKKVANGADALLGAGHILAETFSERADVRGKLRHIVETTGKLACAPAEAETEKGKEFRDYFQYSEALGKVPPHRVLAINRGERAKALRVRLDADQPSMIQVVDEKLVPPEHPHGEFLKGCAHDALERLIVPSLEREFRRELTDKAETHAVEVFARNLRNLLLQPPVRGRRVLAVDPGFRTGCKLAALDEFGNLLDQGVAFLVGKAERVAESKTKMAEMVRQHQLNVIAIGNGTACRETEEAVAEMIAGPLADLEVHYVIVNEAGASVYSASNVGREEFPDFDATLRGTISIGRRLQDPLSELVKISPQNIGVGLYQHDVKQKHLQLSLDHVVESCVNYVGVDLNTASAPLLRYVSGLNQLTARRVVEHRQQYGPFKNRQQMMEVSGVGDSSFTQAAGFLKIRDGDNPLDLTWIHPESYAAAAKVLEKLGFTPATLADKAASAELSKKLAEIDLPALVSELGMGELAVKDILANLARPGRDPREDLPPPIFKKGILRAEDLQEGMELTGTVLNVVDFGAFVDIGLKDSGLVHISQMANRYIKSPHEVVAVGDVVKVWVLGIEKDRRRVSLSMVDPVVKAQSKAEEEARREETRKRDEARREQRKAEAERRTAERQRSGPAPAGQPGAPAGAPRGGQQGGGGQGGGGRRFGGRDDRRGGGGGGDRGRGGSPRGGGQSFVPQQRPQPKAPAPPITDGMKKGKEPLRTFGDLMQLLELQKGGDEPAKPVEAKSEKPAKQKKGPAAAGPAVAETPVDPPVSPVATEPVAAAVSTESAAAEPVTAAADEPVADESHLEPVEQGPASGQG